MKLGQNTIGYHMFPERDSSACDYDAIIVGGGPGGATCALWLKLLGFNPAIIEQRSILGGLQNDSPYYNSWITPLLGLRGVEVAKNIHRNIVENDIPCLLESKVESISRSGDRFSVDVAGQNFHRRLTSRYIIVASGAHARNGGFIETPRILIGPGHKIISTKFDGKTVAILGGGDSAFENYHKVVKLGASKVHIYARTIGARKMLLNGVPVYDITLGPYDVDTETVSVLGQRFDYIIVLYGWEPNVEFAGAITLGRDGRGFIYTDPQTCETSTPDIFAIGEVARRMHPCCLTSMADGVVVAKEIQRRLEDSSGMSQRTIGALLSSASRV